MVPVTITGMTIVFVVIRLGPIDPAAAIVGMNNPEGIARIREQLGLTQPLWQQYIEFMVDLLTFDLGQSWVIARGTPAYDLILIYAPRTIWLGVWSVLIAVVVGIPLGFYAGLNPNTGGDYFASFGGIVWRAMPNFWLAIILVAVLSQSQELLGFSWESWIVETDIVTPPDLAFFTEPMGLLTNTSAWTNELIAALKAVAPAALVLGSASMGNEMRIGRTAVLETINSNYVETARAKGVSERAIVWKHVFRNALIPLVPIITGEAFLLIGGSVVVEVVFAINGLGYLFYTAIQNADLPLVGSITFIFILVLVATNILQDFLYTLIDPRIGYE
jgi:peptide/nickel transport system permease protein